MMVDHTAEIVTLRQQLAAAEARTRSRHNATAADKGNVKLLTYKAKSTPTLDEAKTIPTLDDLSERMAVLLHDMNALRERMATLLRGLQATAPPPRPGPR
jgi:hypothetical protein